jgi:hypothetical protein
MQELAVAQEMPLNSGNFEGFPKVPPQPVPFHLAVKPSVPVGTDSIPTSTQLLEDVHETPDTVS